jgi:D-cysteine desulfhydrase
MTLPRISLCHAPTPLERRPSLDAWIGCQIWFKRDDMTGGAEAGNKVRKLEFLLADALEKRATTVLTCGGLQSNHARATALSCAALGLECILFLRVPKEVATGSEVAAPREQLPLTGNVLLDRMAGAEIRWISPTDYAARTEVMGAAALALRRRGREPYVVPEGGSNGLGSLGYVEAMRELRLQMDLGLAEAPRVFDVLVHACGSGGTTAGTALGAAHFGVADTVRAFAVCEDRAYFEGVVESVSAECRALDPRLSTPVRLTIDDSAKGPAYAVMSSEQKRFLVSAVRKTGIVFDPVYTGKALFGLARAVERGDIPRGAKVAFLHTGGLPGLLAQGDDLAEELA